MIRLTFLYHKSPLLGIVVLNSLYALFGMQAYSQSPTVSPQTSVQIVNATSVESISLSLNGKLDYPSFKQGRHTADAPTTRVKVRYTAENKKTGASADSREIEYTPGANQTLVILGDFSTNVPPDNLPQAGPPPEKPEKPFSPNVLFRVYAHNKVGLPEFVRLRVVNGMPGKTLTFTAPGSSREADQKFTLNPGEEKEIVGQAPVTEYLAVVDGVSLPILMRQEGGSVRNAMLIFFLQEDGQPGFKRAFENLQP